jgi:hypothetical protein
VVALTGAELGDSLKDKAGFAVVGVIFAGDEDTPATTRYYHVEHITVSVPPVAPDGAVLLYLGAELTMPPES